MSYKEARRGAAIAGTVLFVIPVIEVYYGFNAPGPVHFIVATLGLALLGLSGRLR
jgi:hypothetical protein